MPFFKIISIQKHMPLEKNEFFHLERLKGLNFYDTF